MQLPLSLTCGLLAQSEPMYIGNYFILASFSNSPKSPKKSPKSTFFMTSEFCIFVYFCIFLPILPIILPIIICRKKLFGGKLTISRLTPWGWFIWAAKVLGQGVLFWGFTAHSCGHVAEPGKATHRPPAAGPRSTPAGSPPSSPHGRRIIRRGWRGAPGGAAAAGRGPDPAAGAGGAAAAYPHIGGGTAVGGSRMGLIVPGPAVGLSWGDVSSMSAHAEPTLSGPQRRERSPILGNLFLF